ncbi:MAG: hypothetical protein ACI9CF_001597 [Candidatus Omnitrophota bacterium]|jgi:hypothetical protein
MKTKFDEFNTTARDKVLNHAMYACLTTQKNIQIFMNFHFYAVWDFMSLLKELQRRFTNVQRIWYPKENAKLARLVNEIVLVEESDVMESGEVISHYEWYVKAMKECGAWNEGFESFYDFSKISPNLDVRKLANNRVVESFLANTFDAIDSANDHEVAAYFLVGREALVPDMFIELINNLDSKEFPITLFKAYLRRHIEIDSESHSKLAGELLVELCQDSQIKWQEASRSASKALESRRQLWDGVLDVIKKEMSIKSDA